MPVAKKANAVSKILNRMATPVQKFAQLESASGILLILVSIIAIIWANSSFSESYEHLIHATVGFSFGEFSLIQSFQHWVNDGLMVIFFFVVGLEIKREMLIGELSSPRKAALPIFAALGGMLVPALIYTIFNFGGVGQHGWGIPMATDIAFAVGVLVLLGKRIPPALMVFLLAVAIADDLGAVVVIAAFYTAQIHQLYFGFAMLGLGLIWLFRFAGVKLRMLYFILSLGVWFAVLNSGIHATIAGVLLGLLTPLTGLVSKEKLHELARPLLGDLSDANVNRLEYLIEEAESPLDRSIEVLHPWVNFLILPIFALVNAGVNLQGVAFNEVIHHNITLGTMFGLLFGKPIGIMLAAFLACRMKVAELPQGVNYRQLLGVGFLAGIGFTMALFISNLSFKSPSLEIYSKTGILIGSLIAAIVGGIILLLVSKPKSG